MTTDFLSMLDEKGTNLVTTILGNATVADLAKEKENQAPQTVPSVTKEAGR